MWGEGAGSARAFVLLCVFTWARAPLFFVVPSLPRHYQAPWPLLAATYDTQAFAPLAATLTASFGAAPALALCLALLGGVPNGNSSTSSTSASSSSAGAAPPVLRLPPAIAPAKPAPAGNHAAPMVQVGGPFHLSAAGGLAAGPIAVGPMGAHFVPSPMHTGLGGLHGGPFMAAHYFQPHCAVQPKPIAPGKQAPPNRAAI